MPGLALWAGFRAEDFAFFVHPEPRAARDRNRMAGAWERILEELDAGERTLLGIVHTGRFGLEDPVAWAQTNRGDRVINLTLELGRHELQLNLVGWNHDRSTACSRGSILPGGVS